MQIYTERETAGYEVGTASGRKWPRDMLLSSGDDCYENGSMVRETKHTENRKLFHSSQAEVQNGYSHDIETSYVSGTHVQLKILRVEGG